MKILSPALLFVANVQGGALAFHLTVQYTLKQLLVIKYAVHDLLQQIESRLALNRKKILMQWWGYFLRWRGWSLYTFSCKYLSIFYNF